MLTTWEYSVKTEAERLIHCAHQIVVGFYKTNNFLVLPHTPNNSDSQVVIFPDLNYQKISRFWEKVTKVNIDNLPMVIDLNIIEQVSNLILENNIKKPEFGKVKMLWEKVETEVIGEIYKVIPSKKDIIKKIVIYPTVFGTSSSFNVFKDNDEIIIYLREDQGIYAIVESIISSLICLDVVNNLDGVWQEIEMVTDYLVTQTSITKVLVKYEEIGGYLPTLKGVRGKEQVKLMQESDEFYKKLGISMNKRQFSVNDFNNLTNTEKNLLNILIKNENQITDFDTIGGAIFKTEDDFSLYAISKTIQRLRDKFEVNGISGSYIQTLRGKGYMLKN